MRLTEGRQAAQASDASQQRAASGHGSPEPRCGTGLDAKRASMLNRNWRSASRASERRLSPPWHGRASLVRDEWECGARDRARHDHVYGNEGDTSPETPARFAADSTSSRTAEGSKPLHFCERDAGSSGTGARPHRLLRHSRRMLPPVKPRSTSTGEVIHHTGGPVSLVDLEASRRLRCSASGVLRPSPGTP